MERSGTDLVAKNKQINKKLTFSLFFGGKYCLATGTECNGVERSGTDLENPNSKLFGEIFPKSDPSRFANGFCNDFSIEGHAQNCARGIFQNVAPWFYYQNLLQKSSRKICKGVLQWLFHPRMCPKLCQWGSPTGFAMVLLPKILLGSDPGRFAK